MLRIASIITINVHCTSHFTNLNFKLFKEISEIKKRLLYRFRIGLLFFHSVFSSGWYHQIIISSITINPSSETISTIDKTEIYAPASSGWHLAMHFLDCPSNTRGCKIISANSAGNKVPREHCANSKQSSPMGQSKTEKRGRCNSACKLSTRIFVVGFLVGKNARKYAKNRALPFSVGRGYRFINVYLSIHSSSSFIFFFARRCAINLQVIFRESWTENTTVGGVNRLFCIDCQDLIFVDEISLSLVNDGSCVLVAIQFYIDQRVKF